MMTQDDIEKTASLLRQLEPGFLPLKIFNEMARLNVLTSVEVVPARLSGAEVEILLLDRGADDPFWKNEYHTPGAIVLASDTEGTFEDALKRIIDHELRGCSHSNYPVLAELMNIQHARGRANAIVYWLEMDESDAPVGKYFKASRLPANIVASQIEMIGLVAEKFKQYKESLNAG